MIYLYSSVSLRRLSAHTPSFCLSRRLSNSSITRIRFGQSSTAHRLSTDRGWRSPKGALVIGGLTTMSFVYYIAHLERTPETGRLRFMNISPVFEQKLAEEALREAWNELEDKLVPTDHVLSIHIHRVVNQILVANGLGKLKSLKTLEDQRHRPALLHGPTSGSVEDAKQDPNQKEWELFVVNEQRMANARAAYGTIVIFTGILPIARDEQGLAAIIGHELGHVVARHHQEQVSAVKPLLVLDTFVSRFFGTDFGISSYINSLLLLPHSHIREFEADCIGLKLIARACFDPRAALDVLERMHRHEEVHRVKGKYNFASTHPASDARAENIEKQLPDAYAIRNTAAACRDILGQLARFTSTAAGLNAEPKRR